MQPNSATLFHDGNEWIVVITENGVETRNAFAVRFHAVNWLDGQRIRLGLPKDADNPLPAHEI